MKDGGPAFPKALDPYPNVQGSTGVVGDLGMSLRDYFAGQAMVSRLAWFQPYDSNFARVAVDAYKLADAMLKARDS